MQPCRARLSGPLFCPDLHRPVTGAGRPRPAGPEVSRAPPRPGLPLPGCRAQVRGAGATEGSGLPQARGSDRPPHGRDARSRAGRWIRRDRFDRGTSLRGPIRPAEVGWRPYSRRADGGRRPALADTGKATGTVAISIWISTRPATSAGSRCRTAACRSRRSAFMTLKVGYRQVLLD
jgi:hypothetical protein